MARNPNGGNATDKCPALELTCHGCNTKGHIKPACKTGSGTTRTGRVTVQDVVIAKRVYSSKDDSTPLPLMENCKIEPIIMDNASKMIKEPKATILSLFPDHGCQETLIAKSLVPLLGLQVDQSRTKRIQGITGGPTDPCYGTTSFQVSYDGQVTNVMGLVTDTIKDEIILSLKALQRLGIVHEEYPRSQWSVTKKAPTQWAFGRLQRTSVPGPSKSYDRVTDYELKEHLGRRGGV